METVKVEKKYTYADYCEWDDSERWELIDGLAYAMSPSPSQTHQSVLVELAGQLRDFLKGNPCRVFVAPLDVRLNAEGADDTVVQPDIFVVCDESKLKDVKSVIGSPDLIIEILSASTASRDLVTKFRLYQKSGVQEYWIVDPDSKTVTVHVLHDIGYVSRSYNEYDAAVPVEVLDGCIINLIDVFEETSSNGD